MTVIFLSIEVGARWNIRQEQSRRAYLGDRLFAEVVGLRGHPIVFVAGLQGSTRYWGRSFDSLARDHRVIYVDLLGFGRSPWPDLDYTLDDHLAYLRRTLQALGATRNVTIVAHSFGTIVSAYYASRFPNEIQRLILLGTPVYANEEEARKRIWEMSPMAAMFSLRPILAREACLFMGSTRPLVRRILPLARKDLPTEVAEDAVLHSWPSIRGAINNVLLTQPVAGALTAIGRRTVFIHGTRDTVTPVARVQQLAATTGGILLRVDGDHHDYARTARPTVLHAISGE